MPGIDEVKFNAICDHLASNADSLRDTLKKFDTSPDTFYRYISANETKAEQYAQARSKYVEIRLEERDRLNEELLGKLESCNSKIANALQNAYKERIRQIEWDVMKLLPQKYGERRMVELESKVSVAGSLSEARKRAQSAKVSDVNNVEDLL